MKKKMGISNFSSRKFAVGLAALAALGLASCEREEIVTEPGTVSSIADQRISSQVHDYQALVYDHSAMYNALANLPENAVADVDLPLDALPTPAHLRLERNGVVENNMEGFSWNGNTLTSEGVLGLRTFDGVVVGAPGVSGGLAALTLSPTTIGGFVEVAGVTYVIEPIQTYDPNGSNVAIIYTEADMVSRSAGSFCAEQSDPKTATDNATDALRTGPNEVNPIILGGSAKCWNVDVFAHGDYRFLQYYGGSTNNALSALANAVNNASARLKTAGIKLVIPSGNLVQNTTQDSYPLDAQLLLNAVRTADNQTFASKVRDVSVFMTGRDMTLDGTNGVAGICFPSVVCSNPTYSYLAAECFQGVYNARILAHEIAHTLGANHETTCVQSLMYPQYSSTCSSDYPTSYTIGQIKAYTTSYSSCLLYGGC